MATHETPESTRFERILALMIAGLVVLSLLSFFYIILAGVFRYQLDNQFGYTVGTIPVIALPLAFVMLMTLIITNMIRRNKENKK
jgi:uncharacterized membrane protein